MFLELAQGLEEGLLPDEDKPLKALALEGVDETHRESIEVRGMWRKPDRPDVGRPKDGVKLPRVLAVAIVDEMRRVPQRAVKAGDVPRLLRRPFRIRMQCRAGDDDPARPDVDEEEDVGEATSLQDVQTWAARKSVAHRLACVRRNSAHDIPPCPLSFMGWMPCPSSMPAAQ